MGIAIEKIYKSDSQRSKLLKINILLGVIVRGLSVISQLLLVPLTINYITSELYGIWLALSSIVQWISFFDIGFGNGLRNKLGESIALNKIKKGRIYVSTTYAVMTVVFFAMALFMFWISKYINWASILNVPKEYNELLVDVTQILFVTFSIQTVLKLIQNIVQAFQLNALASFMDTMSNVLSLIFVYILTKLMSPNLINIALAFSLAPIIVLLSVSIILYLKKYRHISPNIGYVKIEYAKDIFSLGSGFFIVQIAGLFLYQTINILISRKCGPEDVTIYNVAYKYFSILMMGTTIVLAPLWSAITDAFVKDDTVWIKKIYRKLIKLFIISSFVAILMVIISPTVYKYWVGGHVVITLKISILVALYIIILMWGNIHSIIISGMGKIRFQVYYSLTIMVLFIPLSLLLGEYYKLLGIMIAILLVNFPGIFFGPYQVRSLINKTARGVWSK